MLYFSKILKKDIYMQKINLNIEVMFVFGK